MKYESRLDIFPSEVKELLSGLSTENFFVDGILCGSWLMPIYRHHHNLVYTLRTEDIDFAVETARYCTADIPAILRKLGYLPLMNREGLETFVKDTFSIEFLIHRKGGKDAPYVEVKQMQIRALPLPFMSILFEETVKVDFGEFWVRIPSVECLFLHKLIIAKKVGGV